MHLRALIFGLLFSAPALAEEPAAAATGPTRYAFTDTTSLLYVQVFKDPTTLAADLSHDHAIKATGWTGSMTWDPANPAACAIDITVPVAKLNADPSDLRKKVGYDTMLEDSQRAEVLANLQAANQLNAASYPNITFKSTGCTLSGTTLNVSGTFSMRGKTKSITVPMTFSASSTSMTAKGTFKLKHTDFGFEPFSALLGQLKNKDEMSFTLDIKGVPK